MENKNEGFERYMYIIPLKIKKICPQLMEDEDFLQDCYLDFLEFTRNNKAFNNPERRSRRMTLAHTQIERHIRRALNKRNEDREDPAGLLYCDKQFYDIEETVLMRELRMIFNDLLGTLTEREQEVIEGIYYKNMSYVALARTFDVTSERIRQIEKRSISKLRHPSRAKRYRDFCE